MKKYLFLLLISISFLNATTIYNGKCVETFKPIAYAEPVIYITYSYPNHVAETVPYSIELLNSLVENDGKFIYKTIGTGMTRCYYITSNNTLGLTNEQFTFMSALTGLLTAVLLVFIIFRKV